MEKINSYTFQQKLLLDDEEITLTEDNWGFVPEDHTVETNIHLDELG